MVRASSARTGTRHTNQAKLVHLLSLAGFDRLHDARIALLADGCGNINDFLLYDDVSFDRLTVPLDDKGNYKPLGRVHINWLKILYAYYNYQCRLAKTWIDIGLHTKGQLDAFRTSIDYDPTKPLRPWWTPIPEEEMTKNDKELASWNRSVKPSKSDYLEFRDETQWLNYKEITVITVNSQGLSHVLDESFVPTNLALYERQSNWLFSVFMTKFKTPFSKSLIKKYQTTQDTRALWKELSEHMDESFTGEITVQKLSTFLTSFRLSTSQWKGTQESFILNFAEKARQYNELATDQYTNKQLVTFLNACVNGVKNLQDVLGNYRTSTRAASKATGSGGTFPIDIPFSEYVQLLIFQAQIYDQAAAKNRRTSTNVHQFEDDDGQDDDTHGEDTLETFEHDIDTPVDQMMVMQTAVKTKRPPGKTPTGEVRKVFLNSATWKSLTQTDRESWDKVSEKGKNAILNYGVTRGHTEINKHERDPQLRSVNNHSIILDDDEENSDKVEAKVHEVNKTAVDDCPDPEDDPCYLLNLAATDCNTEGIDINKVLAKYAYPDGLEAKTHEFQSRDDYDPKKYADAYGANASKIKEELEPILETNLHDVDVGGIEINAHEFDNWNIEEENPNMITQYSSNDTNSDEESDTATSEDYQDATDDDSVPMFDPDKHDEKQYLQLLLEMKRLKELREQTNLSTAESQVSKMIEVSKEKKKEETILSPNGRTLTKHKDTHNTVTKMDDARNDNQSFASTSLSSIHQNTFDSAQTIVKSFQDLLAFKERDKNNNPIPDDVDKEDLLLEIPSDGYLQEHAPTFGETLERGIERMTVVLPEGTKIYNQVVYSKVAIEIMKIYDGFPDGYWTVPEVHSKYGMMMKLQELNAAREEVELKKAEAEAIEQTEMERKALLKKQEVAKLAMKEANELMDKAMETQKKAQELLSFHLEKIEEYEGKVNENLRRKWELEEASRELDIREKAITNRAQALEVMIADVERRRLNLKYTPTKEEIAQREIAIREAFAEVQQRNHGSDSTLEVDNKTEDTRDLAHVSEDGFLPNETAQDIQAITRNIPVDTTNDNDAKTADTSAATSNKSYAEVTTPSSKPDKDGFITVTGKDTSKRQERKQGNYSSARKTFNDMYTKLRTPRKAANKKTSPKSNKGRSPKGSDKGSPKSGSDFR